MSAFVECAITLVAYMNAPLLRVRGRTYAFHSQYQNRDASHDGSVSPRAKAIANRAAEPYGGGVSVKKSWWRATFAIGILAVGAYSYFAGDTNAWLTAVSVAAILLTAIVFGYRDAILGHPIASRQHVQFGLLAGVSGLE